MLSPSRLLLPCVLVAVNARGSDDERVPGDLGRILQSGTVQTGPMNDDVAQASRVTQDLAQMASPFAPFKVERVDPVPVAAVSSCDRDYTQSCPDGWLSVGEILGASRGSYCAADAGYAGPCAGEAFSFNGMSVQAKGRWSEACLANWPCTQCERDFQSCPMGWSQAEGSFACGPPPSYSGPCAGASDFRGYTVDMLAHWSSACGAFWPCAASDKSAST